MAEPGDKAHKTEHQDANSANTEHEKYPSGRLSAGNLIRIDKEKIEEILQKLMLKDLLGYHTFPWPDHKNSTRRTPQSPENNIISS
jgi:hypothetical protein